MLQLTAKHFQDDHNRAENHRLANAARLTVRRLTPLDYAVTSNVWAQNDKWKGVMKVRWIYIKGACYIRVDCKIRPRMAISAAKPISVEICLL